mgnify:CR=1 FL=1
MNEELVNLSAETTLPQQSPAAVPDAEQEKWGIFRGVHRKSIEWRRKVAYNTLYHVAHNGRKCG